MSNEYIDKIHKVVEHIHENIDKQMTIKELASIAGFSQYYFHKIFSAFIGEPLSTFIKRIRLETSARKLIYTSSNITEIALSCGYETPSAYTKAFKQFFGVSPSEYKAENNNAIKLNKNKEYHDHLKDVAMKHFKEIRNLKDTRVYYVRKTGNYQTEAPKAYKELFAFIKKHDLCSSESKMIGICYDDPYITEETKCRFDACISSTKDVVLEKEVHIQTIKGGNYAVFLHKGPYEQIGEVYKAICGEWLPSNNYKTRDLPMLEVYLNSPEKTKPEDLLTEILLPIE